MSERIEVGDLVQMVRGHSCALKAIGGVPYIVSHFLMPRGGGWRCPACGELNAGPNEPCAMGLHNGIHGMPLSWLKKIPPLAEPETTERKEELPA